MEQSELNAIHEQVPPEYYDEGVRQNVLQKIWHNKRQLIVERFIHNRGGRLLDLGCHAGFLTTIIAKASGAKVTGIDISPKAIEFARRRAPDMAFVVGDLQEPLPFGEGSFETVTAFDVLEHVPAVDHVFREVHRVLVPGGIFIVGVPRETWLFRLVWKLWTRLGGNVWHDTHVHDLNDSSLRRLAEQNGFTESDYVMSHWGMYQVMVFRRST